jgi:Xaa-Pro aminopeptidase
LIDATALTEAERDWVDTYHARVWETLMPLLDADTQAWLDATTRPLNAAE